MEVDEGGKVVNFLEKPKATETTSRRAVSYVMSRDMI